MDITIWIGIIAGLVAIVGGFLMDGGEFSGLLQFTAALIVFGGTAAAVIISFPKSKLRTIPAALKVAFGREDIPNGRYIKDIVNMATIARRSGVLALERNSMDHPSPFLREGIQLVVDGTDQEQLKQMLSLELDAVEQEYEGYAKVFESAGGYAPTMGIIGTVMGLIHVLSSLTEPTSLGPSIALAFTATLYGVASANLIFLPIASKIKARGELEVHTMELLMHGIIAIQNGENPQLVQRKLSLFDRTSGTDSRSRPIAKAEEGTHESAN